tara:strand:- start:11269 stop:12411 length:1143 start_codon:yes stop_codon:yes gene_type:complete
MWLLEKSAFDAMQSACDAGQLPTIAEQQDFEARLSDSPESSLNLQTSGNKAIIPVNGVLSNQPNLMARFFGGGNTTYSEIRTSIEAANNDQNVKSIDMVLNSPGGQAGAEWMATMEAVRDSKKPVYAIVGEMAASAAYGLASQAKEIKAVNSLSRVGSIGVMATIGKSNNIVKVTSSNAPNKAPDPETAEGVQAIRESIDPIEKVFIDTIASGRGISAKKVSKDFGQGGTLIAQEALENGMIDGFVNNQTAESGNNTKESKIMDIDELKAQHPELFAAAKDEGIQEERSRVLAHVHMAKECNAADLAFDAIETGATMQDQTLVAKYMTAGMAKQDIEAHKEDSDDIKLGSTDEEPTSTIGEQLAASLVGSNDDLYIHGVK